YADNLMAITSYDVHDNLASMSDANGTTVNYSYDLLNRVSSKSVSPAAGVTGTTLENYAYDGLSRLVNAADNDSTVTRQHNSLSAVTRETQQITGNPVRTVLGVYDGVGNRLIATYPVGRMITATYDGLRRPLV